MKITAKKLAKAAVPYGIVRAVEKRHQNQKLGYCPICQQHSEFDPGPGAIHRRKDSICLGCRSLERHRLLYLFLLRKIGIDSLKNKKILHIAAENCLSPKIKAIAGKKYITADMNEPSAMVKMDITDIQYPDNSFDAIICNHVLEHVSDDNLALAEFFRILKKGGWAIFSVPIADATTTYEDKSIKSKSGRLAAFGQDDHVRKYGKDFIDRLKQAGFLVSTFAARDIASRKETKKMRLTENAAEWGFLSTEIFYCQKPQNITKEKEI